MVLSTLILKLFQLKVVRNENRQRRWKYFFPQGVETTEMFCTYITTVDTTVKYSYAQEGIQTIKRG